MPPVTHRTTLESGFKSIIPVVNAHESAPSLHCLRRTLERPTVYGARKLVETDTMHNVAQLASELPRERLLARGAAALSDAELVALLLRTGTGGASALDIARALI